MNKTIQPLTFTLPLSYEAHSIAQECRQGIRNPEKGKQIYLNTLAVYTANYYLQGMGFETDWENSYSRDPVALKLANVADLEVKNLGKLEICPVLPDENSFEISPEVTEDRIGYLAVKFTPSLKEATILGYIESLASIPPMRISLTELKSLEDFLLYLSNLEVEAAEEKETSPPVVAQLSKWLEGLVDEGWQRVEELFASPQVGLAFMNEVTMIRGQQLDLGIHLSQLSLALIVKVTSSESKNLAEADILIQVRPMKEEALPAEIGLQVKDSSGETILETSSREGDNWIQLAFSAESGEFFQITVVYQDMEINRDFLI